MTTATWAIAALTAALLLAIAQAFLTLDRLPVAIGVAAAWVVSFFVNAATRGARHD